MIFDDLKIFLTIEYTIVLAVCLLACLIFVFMRIFIYDKDSMFDKDKTISRGTIVFMLIVSFTPFVNLCAAVFYALMIVGMLIGKAHSLITKLGKPSAKAVSDWLGSPLFKNKY